MYPAPARFRFVWFQRALNFIASHLYLELSDLALDSPLSAVVLLGVLLLPNSLLMRLNRLFMRVMPLLLTRPLRRYSTDLLGNELPKLMRA